MYTSSSLSCGISRFFILMSQILWFFIHCWTWAHAFAPSKALSGGHSEAEGTQSIQTISVPTLQILSPYVVKQNCQASWLLFAKIKRRNHIRKWIMALWRIWVFVTYILVGYITKLGGRVQLTFLIFCDCSRYWNKLIMMDDQNFTTQ
jgi:hypothetical protein